MHTGNYSKLLTSSETKTYIYLNFFLFTVVMGLYFIIDDNSPKILLVEIVDELRKTKPDLDLLFISIPIFFFVLLSFLFPLILTTALLKLFRNFKLSFMDIGLIIIFYFFLLHPYSLAIGGIIYDIFGWTLPTTLVLFITNFIVIKLIKPKTFLLGAISFLSISFIIGLNTNLIHLFKTRSSSKIHTIKIIKPIELPKDKEGVSFKYLEKNEINLKSSFFSTHAIGGNEGQMQFYFEPINMMALSPPSFTTKHSEENFKYVGMGNSGYKLYFKGETKGRFYHLETEVINNFGGKILIFSKYPAGLLAKPYEESTSDLESPYFWNITFSKLLHDNPWNWILAKILVYEGPVDYLLRQSN